MNRTAFAVALFVALLSGDAGAYVRTTLTDSGLAVRWGGPCVSVLVYAGGPPADLPRAVFEAASRGAADAWSRVSCTGLRLAVDITGEESGLAVNDGRNRITFRRKKWCPEPQGPEEPCYLPNAVAMTSVAMRVRDGAIVDADIEINGVFVPWGDATAPGPRRSVFDLQAALTHELGHVLGFDHPCWDPSELRRDGTPKPRPFDHRGLPAPLCHEADSAVQATTMFPTTTRDVHAQRSLEPDDQQAVCDVYPASKPCDDGGCACSVAAPGAGDAGLVLVALLLLRRRRR